MNTALLDLPGHKSFVSKTLEKRLVSLGDEYGHRLALGGLGRPWLTHRELAEFVVAKAQTFTAQGIGRGKVVLVCLPDGPDIFTAILSVASRAIALPIAPEDPVGRVNELIDILSVSAILFDQQHPGVVGRLKRKPTLKYLPISSHQDAKAGIWDFCEPLALTDKPAEVTHSADAAILVQTAGTTALPKLVAWSQASLLYSCDKFADWMGLTEADRSLCVMPFSHLHSVVRSTLPGLLQGGSAFCAPGFDRVNILGWIADVQPTYMTAVPAVFRTILERVRNITQNEYTHSLKCLACGSDRVDAATVDALHRKFGIPIREFYGMSEVSPMLAATPPGELAQRSGRVGKVIAPWILMCLDDAGNELPWGREGEIVAIGGMVNPVLELEPAIQLKTNPACVRTGDRGILDEVGWLTVTGRVDERINRAGKKVSPEPIEAALRSLPEVEDAVVFPYPDELLGQRVAAAIIAKAGQSLDVSRLRGHVSRHLPQYMVPDRIVFVDRFPTNRAGKVLRHELADKLAGECPSTTQPVSRTEPASDTEAVLAHLVKEMLELEVLDLDSEFTALGVDSFQATVLLVEIDNCFGVLLTPAQFVENTSVSALSRLIDRHRSNNRPLRNLTEVQQGDNRCPVFFAHSSLGYAEYAPSFARHFSNTQTVYALKWRQLDQDVAPLSLEQYASGFVDEVLSLAPGPFSLVGHSFGAHLVFELAQQLLERGHEPACVVLVDDEADLHKRRFAERTSLPSGPEIEPQCKHLLYGYVPKVYPGRLILIRAHEDITDVLADPYGGWKDLALGPCEQFVVPGSHLSMVSEGYIGKWAGQLEQLIHRAVEEWKCNHDDRQTRDRIEQLLTKKNQAMKQLDISALVTARDAAKSGDLHNEIRAYRRALHCNKAQPYWVYRNLAEALWQAHEWEDALFMYQMAINAEAIPIEGYRLLAKRLRQMHRLKESAELISLAAKSTPGEPCAQVALAELYMESGQLEAAQKCLAGLQPLADENALVVATLTKLAKLLHRCGHYNEALKIVSPLVSLPCVHVSLLILHSHLLKKIGDREAAQCVSRKIIERIRNRARWSPHLVQDQIIRAVLCHELGQRGEADLAMKEAMRYLPGSRDGGRIISRLWRANVFAPLRRPVLMKWQLQGISLLSRVPLFRHAMRMMAARFMTALVGYLGRG